MPSEEAEEEVRFLFQSDIIPEERLLLALLMDALYCFQKYCFSSDKDGKDLFRESEAWIMDDDLSSPFSFRGACEYLEIDADYLRYRGYQWRDRQLVSRAAVRNCPPIKRVTRLRV